MQLYRILMGLLAVSTLVGCAGASRQEVLPTATLLPALASLPARGRVPCSIPSNAFLFESPGSTPADPDSDDGGNMGRGRRVGEVSPCEVFTITQVAWSTYNRVYFMYVEAADAKGWIMEEDIEVVP